MSSPFPTIMSRGIALSLLLGSSAAAQGFPCDYVPWAREIILNTDLTQIQTSCGVKTVAGGVFLFRSVMIPDGILVRGVGSRPMIWIVERDFVVDGTLSVEGGPGTPAERGTAAQPTLGGLGACTGGDGGRGSPNPNDRSLRGETGYGPYQLPGLGGAGGNLSCQVGCDLGSSGGGGAFATIGDPYLVPAGGRWLQLSGEGGPGCRNGTLRGGLPGIPLFFLDRATDNDFFGLGYDFNRRRFVPGELPSLAGGQGGGGGGDRAVRCTLGDPAFVLDERGGGGGGGGGALVILALGTVRVGPYGSITADGGMGGMGLNYQLGDLDVTGSGGGGSGGMIYIAGGKGVELWVHGETWANGDEFLSISARGGYRATTPPALSSLRRPGFGGVGGLGIVHLSAPIGPNQDGTNTVLDDNIHLLDGNGQRLAGAQKQRYLGWRGFQDATGTFVDDSGSPTGVEGKEGDIKPSPVLLPFLR